MIKKFLVLSIFVGSLYSCKEQSFTAKQKQIAVFNESVNSSETKITSYSDEKGNKF